MRKSLFVILLTCFVSGCGTGEERFFSDPEKLEKEKNLQRIILEIRKKYGKNAILKGTSLQDGATARERHQQIGGHRA